MNGLRMPSDNEIVVALEDKTIEELAEETNDLYVTMQHIGTIGLQVAAGAGQRLLIIKEKVGHGNWQSWAEENLNFSFRKANNMMNLAKKMGDENSLFSKTQIFADIGISKVWALLAAPEEVAEEVAKDPKTEDCTVAELKEEIKKTTEAYEQTKEKQIELQRSLRQAEMEKERLEKELQEAQSDVESEKYEEEIELLNKKLNDLKAEKSNLIKAAKAEAEEKAKKLAEKAVAEAEQKATEAIKNAEAEAQKTIEEKTAEAKRKATAEKEELEAEITKLKKEIAGNNSAEITAVKIHSKIMQENFNTCIQKIAEIENEEEKAKLKKYMTYVINQMQRLVDPA